MRVLITDHQPRFVEALLTSLRAISARPLVDPGTVSLRRGFLPHVIVGSNARFVAHDPVLLQAATVATSELPEHVDAWPRGWLDIVSQTVVAEGARRLEHEAIPEPGQQASWYALRALAFASTPHRVLLVGPTRVVVQTAAGHLHGDEFAYELAQLSMYEVGSVIPISKPSMPSLGSFRNVLRAIPREPAPNRAYRDVPPGSTAVRATRAA